jgi:hypothetical protein
MRQEPAHVVHAWLGNSREVAEDHYLMVTDADYARASTEPAATASTEDPVSKAVQKAVQSATVSNRQEPSAEKEAAVSPAFAKDTAVQIPPRGVEETQYSAKKPVQPEEGGAESGAVGAETAQLLGLLASLSPAQRELLLAIVRAKN